MRQGEACSGVGRGDLAAGPQGVQVRCMTDRAEKWVRDERQDQRASRLAEDSSGAGLGQGRAGKVAPAASWG